AVPAYQVPFVRLHVAMHIDGQGETWFDVRFYLVSIGPEVEYISKVSGPALDAVAGAVDAATIGLVKASDIASRIEAAIDGLGRARFGAAFTPWLCGEPERDMAGLSFDTGRGEIVVKYVGRPPAASTAPVKID